MDGLRICRRCLLEESDAGLFNQIKDYISSLSPEIRTRPEVYRERLKECQSCANLVNGMCGLCGCFVEVRAAKSNQYCPGTPGKW